MRTDLVELPGFGSDVVEGELAGKAQGDEPFWFEMADDHVEDLAGTTEEFG